MIIGRPLVGECLQFVKEPTNRVDKDAVAVLILIATAKKRWLAMCNRNLHDCTHVSFTTPLRSEYLWNLETCQPCRSIWTGNPSQFSIFM